MHGARVLLVLSMVCITMQHGVRKEESVKTSAMLQQLSAQVRSLTTQVQSLTLQVQQQASEIHEKSEMIKKLVESDTIQSDDITGLKDTVIRMKSRD